MITAVMPIRIDERFAEAYLSLDMGYMKCGEIMWALNFNETAKARNECNDRVESGIIIVCDSANTNFLNRTSDISEYFKQHPDIDIYCTAYTDGKRVYTPSFPEGEKPNIYHCAVSYRKRVADKIKYREGNPWTDNYEAFMFEARRAGFKFGFSNEPFVFKREKPFSLRKHIHRTIARVKIYKEFGVLWQWKTIKSLIPNVTR